MDDGERIGSGIKLSTQAFLEEDVIILKEALFFK